jgi:two-component system phosphate regulon response regulator PhoB
MATGQTILVVDDEAAVRQMVSYALSRAGYEVLEAEDGQQAFVQMVDGKPDLVLLDWMLPDVSGIEILRRMRREEISRKMPVIMLTARVTEDDTLSGLNSGADDYVTKPFSPRELIARIEAVLRRMAPEDEHEIIEAGDLHLDPVSHRVNCHGREVSLGPTEFRMLHFFMSHPERVYSRTMLLDHVWGQNVYVEERTVDVHIRRLRKALSEHSCDGLIQTVRGAGYRFSTQ